MLTNYPEDWNKHSLDKLFKFSGGYSATRKDLGEKGIPYLHYGDIHTSKSTELNIKKDYENIPRINLKLEEKHNRFLLKDGDITFVDASEDYEGVSKYFVIKNKENIPIISGLHTIVARDKSGLLDTDFKKYVFQNHEVKKQFKVYCAGQKVKGINKENIKKIEIPIPPIIEQKRIADIISTWDKVIELLENKQQKLNDKKVKLSYELLFSGEKYFKDSDKKKLSMQEMIDKGFFRLIKPSETKKFEKLLYLSTSSIQNDLIVSNEGFVSYEKRPSRAQLIPEKNSVFFAKMKDSIKVYLFNNVEASKYIVSTGYFGLSVNENKLSPDYIKQIFLSDKFNYLKDKFSEGSSQSGMKNTHLSEIDLPVYNIDIQKKIGHILSLLDKENELLSNEISKIKLQKQGIMQQLLTGKIRVQS